MLGHFGGTQKPIRTRYLDHVTGYQPIRDQYFLIRSVHVILTFSFSEPQRLVSFRILGLWQNFACYVVLPCSISSWVLLSDLVADLGRGVKILVGYYYHLSDLVADLGI
eukprot:sb/3477378/